MYNKALIFIILGLLTNHHLIFAQCFASPGNPIAGSVNIGILDKGVIRTIGFYQYGLLDQYYEGNRISDYSPPGVVSSAHYNYSGLSIGYGFSNSFTLETEIGYFFNRTQEYKYLDHVLTGKGFSNAVISAKFNLYKNRVKNMEYTLSLGSKIPFSTKPKAVDGVELPVDLQPSTGNFGFVIQSFFVKEFDPISARFIWINRYDNNFTESQQGYNFGDSFNSSLFFSKHLANPWTRITKDITLIMQARYEFKDRNQRNGIWVDYSGSHLIFISPQINYNLNMLWNFSLIYDFPVYQYYNGIQLGHNRTIAFSIARDFGYGI